MHEINLYNKIDKSLNNLNFQIKNNLEFFDIVNNFILFLNEIYKNVDNEIETYIKKELKNFNYKKYIPEYPKIDSWDMLNDNFRRTQEKIAKNKCKNLMNNFKVYEKESIQKDLTEILNIAKILFGSYLYITFNLYDDKYVIPIENEIMFFDKKLEKEHMRSILKKYCDVDEDTANIFYGIFYNETIKFNVPNESRYIFEKFAEKINLL